MGKKNRLPGCREHKCVVNMKNGKNVLAKMWTM